jgi:hypothetical protein
MSPDDFSRLATFYELSIAANGENKSVFYVIGVMVVVIVVAVSLGVHI